MNATAQATLLSFQDLIDQTAPQEADVRLRPDAWTLKEIVGHLVDSAGNNHQRFVRLQFGDMKAFPGYEAEPWAAAQHYATADWQSLTTLWRTFNEHLAHVAANLPADALDNCWQTPDGPLTLRFLVADYYTHMQLHVEHYAERLAEIRAAGG